MAYIPEEHEKYNLLPYCQKNGKEVFVYPSELLNKLQNINPEIEFPYGYNSYEEYYKELDEIYLQADNEDLRELILQYKKNLLELNDKHYWSILKYIGKDNDSVFGLTSGLYYYWPSTKDKAVYSGVVDNEEFTSYIYSTDPQLWEIAEDPTQMAYNTIYKNKNSVSQDSYDNLMAQVKFMLDNLDEN